MHSSKRTAFKRSSRATFASLIGLCALVACSSSDNAPNPATGGTGSTSAGAAGSNAGAAGAAVGAGGASGSAGAATTAGAGQGGVPAGGGGGTAGAGAGGAVGGAGAGGDSSEPFALTSSAFKEGEQIPLMYKCMNVNPMGQNVSPPLSWGPGPAGTKSYAIVLMHLPSPEHWVIWDIAPTVRALPENVAHQAQPAVPAGSKQSLANLDGFQGSGYFGPCPQAVNAVQSYRFTLYALDVDTLPGLTATSTPGEAAAAVKAHLVPGSQGVSLTGTQIRSN